MKGLELPINVLVLIAVAVIVLLGIVALYFTGFLGPAGQVSLSSVVSTACANWRARGPTTVSADLITINNYDADGDTALDAGDGCDPAVDGDNLEILASRLYAAGACSAALVDSTDNTIRTRVCGFT